MFAFGAKTSASVTLFSLPCEFAYTDHSFFYEWADFYQCPVVKFLPYIMFGKYNRLDLPIAFKKNLWYDEFAYWNTDLPDQCHTYHRSLQHWVLPALFSLGVFFFLFIICYRVKDLCCCSFNLILIYHAHNNLSITL